MDQSIVEFLSGYALWGIPAVVLIPFLIAGFRKLGMPVEWTGFVALGLGLLMAVLIQAVKTWPVIEPWVQMVVAGVVLGLACNGAYSQVKMFLDKRGERREAGE